MSIPPLQTIRLTVREYTLADLDAHHRLVTEAFRADSSRDDTRAWLDWTVRNYRELAKLHQPPYGDFAIWLNAGNTYVGSVGLVQSLIPWAVLGEPPSADYRLSPEFGLYWGILPEYWGNGYAGEAGRAMLDLAFTTLRAQRVVATTERDNHNSQRVMQKLGMTVKHNPLKEPFWFETVGVLQHSDYAKGDAVP